MKKLFAKFFFELTLKLEEINHRSIKAMAKIEDVQAGIDKVIAAAQAEKVEVKAKLDDLSAQIAGLADQLANGASADQLDTIVSELNDAADQISGIYDASGSVPPADTPVDTTPVVDTPVDSAPPVDAPVPADSGDVPPADAQPVLP